MQRKIEYLEWLRDQLSDLSVSYSVAGAPLRVIEAPAGAPLRVIEAPFREMDPQLPLAQPPQSARPPAVVLPPAPDTRAATSPTPINDYDILGPEAFGELLDSYGADAYPVWFGTNRVTGDLQDPLNAFLSEIDDEIHFGICMVKVPPQNIRRIGSLGTTSKLGRFLRFITFKPDDRIGIEKISHLTETTFYASISNEMLSLDAADRTIVVYIHGYNITFDEAIIRAAQLGFDLDIQGIMAAFSWPAVGKTLDYVSDKDASEYSRYFLAQYLVDLVKQTHAESIHVIAHSMGNRTLLLALDDIARRVVNETGKPFNQLILADADILQIEFEQMAQRYRDLARKVTIYASSDDHVLAISQKLAGNRPRVGVIPPPFVVEGIDTIETTHVPRAFLSLGHRDVLESRILLQDMKILLHLDPSSGTSPPDSGRLLTEFRDASGAIYWGLSAPPR